MKIIYSALVLIFILACLPGKIIGQTGHSITIMAKAGPEMKVRLAYHVGSQQYVKDSLITDSGGKGRFSASETLPEGVYMIVLPDNQFFEFLLGKDQYFDINFDRNDPAATISFTGSDENSRFIAYQRKWKSLQEEAMKISGRLNGLKQGSLKRQPQGMSLQNMRLA